MSDVARDLEMLECHFTWGLRAEEADLNFLEVKFRDVVSLRQNLENNLMGRSYNFLAYVKHLQGFNQEALDYLAHAEGESANDEKHCIVTYGNFAWVHHLMGDDITAQTYLLKLEQIQESIPEEPLAALPREVLAEKAWALLKFSKNHYEEARDYFYEALQGEPDDREWNMGYAFALFRWNGLRIIRKEILCTSVSLEHLEKALALDPDNSIIMVHLAHVHKNNGNLIDAWDLMKKALDLSPDNLSVVLKVAKFLRQVQRYDMALAALNRMLKLAPNSPRLHQELASNYRWKSFRASGEVRNRELILLSIAHTVEEIRLNPSYIYPRLELALRYAEVLQLGRAEEIFQEMFTRGDLNLADQQALHRTYGDFMSKHMGFMRAGVTHYMEGMKLQNISSDWKVCRKRLLKIQSKRRIRGPLYFEISEFLYSFHRNKLC